MSKKARVRNRIILIVFLLILATVYLYLLAMDRGKYWITRQLENSFGRKTTIDSVSIRPPFKFNIDNVKVQDLLTIREIEISPSFIGMLLGRVAFNNIVLIEPTVSLGRDASGNFSLNFVEINNAIKKLFNKRLFFVSKLQLEDGRLNFYDFKISQEGFKVSVEDIDILASKVSLSALPVSAYFTISAKSAMLKDAVTSVLFQGWINPFRKDLRANFNLKNFDLSFFAPYYNLFAVSEIKSGLLNLEASLNAKNNDLTVDCQGRLNNFTFKDAVDKKAGFDVSSYLNSFLAGFSSEQETGALQKITIKGKLLPFKINKIDFDLAVDKTKTKDFVSPDPHQIIDKVKETGKILDDLNPKPQAN